MNFSSDHVILVVTNLSCANLSGLSVGVVGDAPSIQSTGVIVVVVVGVVVAENTLVSGAPGALATRYRYSLVCLQRGKSSTLLSEIDQLEMLMYH